MPTDPTLRFTNVHKQLKAPFVAYADFVCILKDVRHRKADFVCILKDVRHRKDDFVCTLKDVRNRKDDFVCTLKDVRNRKGKEVGTKQISLKQLQVLIQRPRFTKIMYPVVLPSKSHPYIQTTILKLFYV